MKKNTLLLLLAVCAAGLLHAQEGTGKIIFSKEQKAPKATSKESFTSGEYIYGSVDLGGKTVNDYFKLPAITQDYPYAYLYYIAEVYKGDKMIGTNTWTMALVKETDKKNTFLNFDVLPEPGKAVTLLSGTPMYDAGLSAAPLYRLIEQQKFRENGTYTIKISIYNRTLDVYGKEQPYQKWPTCEGSFSFVFNEDDVPTLLKNSQAADATVKKKGFK